MKRRTCFLVAAAVAAIAFGKTSLDIEFVKGLLAIPSESRNIPECNRATAYLRGYLERHGVFCQVERTEEGRDALYAATLPGKECEVGFITHIDVVPALAPEQFQPKIVGDDIIARGACDTKLNAAVMAQALVALKGRASVGCYFATDEDGCAGKVPTCTMLLNAGFRPTRLLVVGDTGGGTTNAVSISQKGHWGFKLVTKGREGHSSIPWKLDNPIPKLTRAVERIMAAYPMPSGDGSWRSTLAPTVLKAGEASNSIPGGAEVTFSFRYVGKNDVKELTELIRRETGLEPVTLYCVPPVVNDPQNPEIVAFRRAMDAFWPDQPSYIREGQGATDAFQFSHLDLPCVIVTHNAVGGHKLHESGSLKSAEEYLNFYIKYFAK